MDDKIRCQSCGMPLGVGFYGTNKDDSPNEEYCKYCFEKGEFREPNLTMDEMIGRSIANMMDDKQMGEDEATNLAKTIIPTLKRWTKTIESRK